MTQVAALFFLSGMAALVVETTWLRWFRLLFGATAPAASATLAAVFAGHALGAAWAARQAPRWRRPLAAWGVLELAAAAGALAVPLVLRLGESASASVYDPLRERPALLSALRFALALSATLPAAFAVGATLPAVGAAVVRRATALGSRGSALYAWNLLGAALGTALAAFLLPQWLGVRGGYALGMALEVGVGLAALGLARRDLPAPAPARAAEVRRPRAAPLGPRALLGLAALSGFTSLAAQVLLVQAYAQVLNQSVYAFASVLVVVLAALAAGAALVSFCERRALVDPLYVLAAGTALGGIGLMAFPRLLHHATHGLQFLGSDGAWPGYAFAALALAAGTAGPLLLCAAVVLPATFALAGAEENDPDAPGRAGAWLGRLAAANTLGAIAGALAASWLLLPTWGLWQSFVLLGCVPILAWVWIGVQPSFPARPLLMLPVALSMLVAMIAAIALSAPHHVPLVRLERGERLVRATSSAAGVVAVIERPDGLLIRTDNHYVLGGTAEQVHEERQGHLPLLLHPRARRAAFVGTATGITAGAAVAHPLESITLVEIVPAVTEAARRNFAAANRGVFQDPRAAVVLDDARNFLRATEERFDVVVADLFVPWQSGTASLYAREHFAAVRQHLLPGGLFCQWLPLYQLTRAQFESVAHTFTTVFPDAALWRGDFYGRYPIAALVGFTGPRPPVAEIQAAATRLAVAGEGDRWVTDPAGLFALYVGPLGPVAESLSAAPVTSDDRPRIEHMAARGHAGGQRGVLEPFVGTAWARFAEEVRAAARRAGDPVFPDLSADAQRASDGGAALQMAGAFFAEGRQDEAARWLARAAELLPPHLLMRAPADPTAAEVWHGLP